VLARQEGTQQERHAPTAVKVDVVVVAYNSADTIRACVESLTGRDDVRVVVVDNASPDDSLDQVSDLPITAVRAAGNGGFAAGCNLGIAAGDAPYVLLLNPDARPAADALDALVAVLDEHPGTGIVGPRLLDGDGGLAFSQRRFPEIRSTWAQAFFLHRVFPQARWVDELLRDTADYERPGTPEWVSGACMLIRRDLLEQIGGLDEGFFLYVEDLELCTVARERGWEIRFEPRAVVAHAEGHSADRSGLLALLARNRVLYARRHRGRVAALASAAGIALGCATHALTSIHRPRVARGHLAALRATLRPSPTPMLPKAVR
jgi:GT2 family glycosyltransferase